MLPEKFILISVLLNLWSTGLYVRAILRGEARPNRVTWFMWALAGFIATAAQLAGGVGFSTLLVFAAGFGPLVIFLVSFANKKAYWETTTFDLACGLLALCGMIGWWLTRDGDFAIVFSIAADFVAAVPALRKSWFAPESENGPTYLVGASSGIIGILCVQQPRFTAYAFTVYIAFISAALTLLVYRKKLFMQAR